MNNFELIEAVGVGIIVCLQAYNFFQTNRRIAVFRKIFPPMDQFAIHREMEGGETVELIAQTGGGNAVTKKIVHSLNTYLLRNKGVASDFHLIKDVVERNCDSLEEEIHQTISLPLYLGLLGTFLGIIVGLVKISGIDFGGENNGMDMAISALLKGVMIAMVASFLGLALTVLNNGLFFKVAKARLGERRNDFYTFIQTELLPVLNQNINSTFASLQQNLYQFNSEFKTNLIMLKEVMGNNYHALASQEKILNSLENMDITAFGKANVIILQELNLSTERLAQFNAYLGQLNELIQATRGVSGRLDSALERGEHFDALGQRLVSMFEENQQLTAFLKSHYQTLDDSRQLIVRAVNGVGNTLDDSLEKLKLFTQERINEVQKITLREMDMLQNQYPEKWKNLDSLAYLETMNRHLSELKQGNVQQSDRMDREFRELNSSFDKAVLELSRINNYNEHRFGSRVSTFFHGLGRKKAKK